MYKVGDILYCTKGDWVNGNNITLFNPPKQGEEVVVHGVKKYKGRELLQLNNQPANVYYPAKHFKPRHFLFANEVLEGLTKNPNHV